MSKSALYIADVTKTVYNSRVYEPSDVMVSELRLFVQSAYSEIAAAAIRSFCSAG